jgi:NADPH2:quinone reductase
MRAVRVHAFGAPLHVDDVPEPEPGDGEVLFEVGFVGVNPLDLWVADGTVAGGTQPLPFVLGSEASGTIEGRAVMVRGGGVGTARDGLYRALAAVPVDTVVDVPAGVDPQQAAGLGVAGETAWRLVHDVARVTPDDRVLVLGASGGVGSLVVQLAKAAGAAVTGQTSSQDKVAFVREMGADDVVVADADDLTDAASGTAPTVVIDPLAGAFTGAAVAAMAPFGRLILYGASAGATVDRFDLRALYRKSVDVLTYSGTMERQGWVREGMALALAAVARGELHVPIDEVLPLERAQEAHDRIRRREVRGKLLLRP